MPSNETRAERNARWIETNCVIPDGPNKGQCARLSNTEKETLRQIYDSGPLEVTVTERPLSAFLALLHLCGYEYGLPTPEVNADVFTVWNAAAPNVQAYLQRKGEVIVCPELGLRYPRAA